MQILKVQDPRDTLEKARRPELVKFAEQHRVAEIDPAMPATLMRKILRSKGLTSITIPNRQLGQISGTRINTKSPVKEAQAASGSNEPPKVVEVDADEDLLRQWKAQQAEVYIPPQPEGKRRRGPERVEVEPEGPYETWPMHALRKFAKRRGIVVPRRSRGPDVVRLMYDHDKNSA